MPFDKDGNPVWLIAEDYRLYGRPKVDLARILGSFEFEGFEDECTAPPQNPITKKGNSGFAKRDLPVQFAGRFFNLFFA